jgi:hypothetical protein
MSQKARTIQDTIKKNNNKKRNVYATDVVRTGRQPDSQRKNERRFRTPAICMHDQRMRQACYVGEDGEEEKQPIQGRPMIR